MLLRQMKYFLAVADCKSFSEAAEQCFISQSAISQQMKVLEDELGSELIKRSNRRFQLTDIGEYFYTRSKAIVQETEDLKEEIRKMSTKQNKQFRIGCRSGYIVRRFCTAMNTFLDDHKDISIEVVYGDHDELMSMLHKGELDMVFNDLRHENEASSFGNVFVEEVEGMVAVSVRSPLAKQEEAKVEAAKAVAIPGTSEHQLGLAVDIVDANMQDLTDEQENTETQKWLMANSWRYGFIHRYPNGRTDITGIIYEPWHYRYVGKDAAQDIFNRDITLEEYLGKAEH